MVYFANSIIFICIASVIVHVITHNHKSAIVAYSSSFIIGKYIVYDIVWYEKQSASYVMLSSYIFNIAS